MTEKIFRTPTEIIILQNNELFEMVDTFSDKVEIKREELLDYLFDNKIMWFNNIKYILNKRK